MIKNIFILSVLSVLVFANSFDFKIHENYSPGYRVVIDGKINDDSGVYDARIYFKDTKQKIYHFFSPMECKGDSCKGVIPIASKFTKSFKYIVLYQNNAGDVFKTREFEISKKDMVELPSWQIKDTNRLNIKTELEMIPKQMYGFDDKVRVKKVSDDNKIGVLAGIVDPQMAGIKDKEVVSGEYDGKLNIKETKMNDFGEMVDTSFLHSPYMIGGLIILLLAL
jgi:hypothetical protein